MGERIKRWQRLSTGRKVFVAVAMIIGLIIFVYLAQLPIFILIVLIGMALNGESVL